MKLRDQYPIKELFEKYSIATPIDEPRIVKWTNKEIRFLQLDPRQNIGVVSLSNRVIVCMPSGKFRNEDADEIQKHNSKETAFPVFFKLDSKNVEFLGNFYFFKELQDRTNLSPFEWVLNRKIDPILFRAIFIQRTPTDKELLSQDINERYDLDSLSIK